MVGTDESIVREILPTLVNQIIDLLSMPEVDQREVSLAADVSILTNPLPRQPQGRLGNCVANLGKRYLVTFCPSSTEGPRAQMHEFEKGFAWQLAKLCKF